MKRSVHLSRGFAVFFLVIFGFVGFSQSSRLQACDICRCDSSARLVDCSGANLTTLPDGIPTNVSKLDLSHNNLTSMPDDFAERFPELMKLDARGNAFTTIPPGAFIGLDSIGVLYIGNNPNCMNLTEDAVNGLGDALQELHLDGVNVTGTMQGAFLPVNGQVMIRLHMNWMNLKSLPCGIFSNLSITYMLDLSFNSLSSLPDFFLSSSPDLSKLYLGHNKLRVISNNTFAGLYSLQELYLYENDIHVINGQPFMYTNLASLFLYYNNLTSLDHAYFATYYRTLNKLYISGGKLNKVPHIGQDDFDIFFIEDTFNTTFEVTDLEMLRNFEPSGFDCYPPSSEYAHKSTCMPCRKGYYGDGVSSGCKVCPPGGFFQNETGQMSAFHGEVKCKHCNDGTYVTEHNYPGKHASDCEVCPTGTYKDGHAGYRACYCLNNYFRRDRFGACEPCPTKGINCSQEHQRLLPGFWWTWDWGCNKSETERNIRMYEGFVTNLKVSNFSYHFQTTRFAEKLPKAFPCPLEGSCANDQGDVQATCGVGYDGWLCTECSTNYYSWFQYCFQCPELWKFVLEVSAILLVFSMVLILAFWHYRRRQEQNRSLIDVIFARFKIVLGFYQVSGAIFSSLHDVSWPSRLSGLGDILQVLELNILQLVAKPHCFIPKLKFNAYDEFIISISFIILVLFSALIGYFCMLCYLTFKQVGQIHLRHRMLECKKKCYMYILLLLFITYPSMCNVTLSLLPTGCDDFCLDEEDIYCVRKLRTDYSIDCSTKEHHFFTCAAYIALTYVIGFPILLLVLLFIHSRGKYTSGKENAIKVSRKNNKGRNFVDLSREPDDDDCLNINGDIGDLDVSEDDDPLLDISTSRHTDLCSNNDEQSFPLWLRFLCENYRDEFWFWEVLELLRKILQTALVVLYGSDDPWYLTVTIAISVAFLTSHAYFKPMKDNFEHRLQMSSLAAVFLNLLVAMALMMPNEQQSSPVEAMATTILLILLNVVVVVLVAVNIIVRVLKSVRRSKKKSNSIVEGTLECLSITAALFGYMATIFSHRPDARVSEGDQGQRMDDNNNSDRKEAVGTHH
ncbi:uncharacterized protein [Amphiura filiformis]|uniref:uncharacterized protein n=1 Tax=Amphiura filiformis TaxID=82378 RepID=UPI003B216F9B